MPMRWDRIPPFRGHFLLGFRLVWIAFFMLALGSMALSYSTERRIQAELLATYHAGVRIVSTRPVRVAPFGTEAQRLIAPGERLLAIDGRQPPAGSDGLAAVLTGPDGSRVTLDLERADQSHHRIVLTRSASHVAEAFAGSGLTFAGSRWAMFAMMVAISGIWLATSALLFLRRAQDPVAAFISLGMIVSGNNPADLFPNIPELIWWCIGSLGWALSMFGILLFPTSRFTPRWTWAAVPLLLVYAPFRMLGYDHEWAKLPTVLFGASSLLVAVAAVLARYRGMAPGTGRQQIKFTTLGLAAAAFWWIAETPVGHARTTVGSVGSSAWLDLAANTMNALGHISLAGGLLVSLLRYRLYDADAVISRSAGYAFLTLLLGAAFAGSEKVIEVLGEELFGESMRAVSAGLGAAVAAILIAPLHGRVHRWTEHRFQKALSNLRRDLPRLMGDMREVVHLDHLLATIVTRIERGVRAKRGAVLLRDEAGLALARASDVGEDQVSDWQHGWHPPRGEGLDCDRDDPLFPVRIPLHVDGAGTIGWILLGPRPDGSFYGKEEREALAEIADPIARAIHIVRQRDAREAERDARERAMEQRVSLLETLFRPSAGAA